MTDVREREFQSGFCKMFPHCERRGVMRVSYSSVHKASHTHTLKANSYSTATTAAITGIWDKTDGTISILRYDCFPLVCFKRMSTSRHKDHLYYSNSIETTRPSKFDLVCLVEKHRVVLFDNGTTCYTGSDEG